MPRPATGRKKKAGWLPVAAARFHTFIYEAL